MFSCLPLLKLDSTVVIATGPNPAEPSKRVTASVTISGNLSEWRCLVGEAFPLGLDVADKCQKSNFDSQQPATPVCTQCRRPLTCSPGVPLAAFCSCAACARGSVEGLTNCTVCAKGSYAAAGDTSCTLCGNGTTTAARGA